MDGSVGQTETARSVFVTPAFIGTAVAFGIFGFVTGVWEVLLADLRTALTISTGAFGVALTAGFAGALPSMLIAGRISDRVGPRPLIGVTGVGMSLALLALAVTDSYWVLVGVFLWYFGANSAYDVGINAAGIDVEQIHDTQILAYFHAAFSGCAALGALVTGVLLFLGVGFRQLYICLAIVLTIVVAVLVVSRTFPNRNTSDESEDLVTSLRDEHSLFRNSALLLVAGIVCLAYFTEGTIENWAAIYLRTWLTFPAVVGASVVAVFHAAMATGRLGGARVLSRVSRRRLLQIAGVCGAGGMLVALATTIVPIILVGVFVVGLSMAVVAPVGFSLAGDLAPDRPGEASSVVTFIGWSAFVISPAIIGGLAELVGLRFALSTVVVAASLIVVGALRIPDRVSE
jgi:MFS family permease